MHCTKKRNAWKLWLMGAAAAAALTVPMTNTTARADDAVEVTSAKAPSSPPIQVSGTVEKYFTDQSGLVTALDLNSTTGGVHRVRFAPSWARRLLDNYPVGSTLDGWVVEHNDYNRPLSDLVSIGAERPNRFVTDAFHTGDERLDSRAWIWKDAATERVTGSLDHIIVNTKGEVLALVLKDGSLVRVPREVKHQERGARGSKHVAQLFPGAEVTAWGPQVWHARGDVSIYGQRVASNGLSINGKTVSAIGIQNMETNSTLFGSAFTTVHNTDGGYSPFEPSMEKTPPPHKMSNSSKSSCGCG